MSSGAFDLGTIDADLDRIAFGSPARGSGPRTPEGPPLAGIPEETSSGTVGNECKVEPSAKTRETSGPDPSMEECGTPSDTDHAALPKRAAPMNKSELPFKLLSSNDDNDTLTFEEILTAPTPLVRQTNDDSDESSDDDPINVGNVPLLSELSEAFPSSKASGGADHDGAVPGWYDEPEESSVPISKASGGADEKDITVPSAFMGGGAFPSEPPPLSKPTAFPSPPGSPTASEASSSGDDSSDDDSSDDDSSSSSDDDDDYDFADPKNKVLYRYAKSMMEVYLAEGVEFVEEQELLDPDSRQVNIRSMMSWVRREYPFSRSSGRIRTCIHRLGYAALVGIGFTLGYVYSCDQEFHEFYT